LDAGDVVDAHAEPITRAGAMPRRTEIHREAAGARVFADAGTGLPGEDIGEHPLDRAIGRAESGADQLLADCGIPTDAR
jgi:hypothetical protein